MGFHSRIPAQPLLTFGGFVLEVQPTPPALCQRGGFYMEAAPNSRQHFRGFVLEVQSTPLAPCQRYIGSLEIWKGELLMLDLFHMCGKVKKITATSILFC